MHFLNADSRSVKHSYRMLQDLLGWYSAARWVPVVHVFLSAPAPPCRSWATHRRGRIAHAGAAVCAAVPSATRAAWREAVTHIL